MLLERDASLPSGEPDHSSDDDDDGASEISRLRTAIHALQAGCHMHI